MGDLDDVKVRLETRLQELTGRVARIDSHLREPGNQDWQERATETENDEVLERLSETETREIGEIRAALARIGAGTYGVCQGCGQPIAPKRLDALPFTSRCIECAA